MSKMYQINQNDLADLERIVPAEFENCIPEVRNTPRFRTACRRVKDILSDIRWNYHPHIEIIPVDEDENP